MAKMSPKYGSIVCYFGGQVDPVSKTFLVALSSETEVLMLLRFPESGEEIELSSFFGWRAQDPID
jgi:hypothetical protein